MALLSGESFSVTKPVSGGDSLDAMVLDEAALVAISVINADSYFNQVGNLQHVIFNWKHSSGAVKYAIFKNEDSDNFPLQIPVVFWDASHAGAWDLDSIVLKDKDGLSFTVESGDVPSGFDFTVSAGGDAYTKLLLHCESALDSSDSAHTVTNIGSVGFAAGKFNNGADYNGTYRALRVGTHADFNMGSGAFTFDWQAKFNDTSTDTDFTRGFFNADDGAGSGYRCTYHWSSNTIRVYSDDNTQFSSSSWTPTPGTFYHIEIARDSNTLYFFVDGVATGTADVTGKTFNTNGNDLNVGPGKGQSGSEGRMYGVLDEFRVSKGIARHTSGFTPPVAEY